MSKRDDKATVYRRYLAGIATEVALAFAIFAAAFIIIIVFGQIIW